MYALHMGIPEMKALWDTLTQKHKSGTLSSAEENLYKLMGKAMRLIATDPRYPGLQTHEIAALSKRYGMKVWQSYLEKNTPRAGRIFWVYGPEKGDITIIGLEPHPEDKANAYQKITLSALDCETV